MLHEIVANEMDPNLVLIRLGHALDKDLQSLDKSSPISSVQHGDTFGVSFRRASFEKKRDAQNFSRLNRDSKHAFFEHLASALDKAQLAFDERFASVFLKADDGNTVKEQPDLD